MKKFSKILLGAILSVTMAVTSVLAFNNMQNAYAKSYLFVDGHGAIYSPTGDVVEQGTYAQPNKTTTSFTGIKLTGGTGATFNLGEIDISTSKWANSDSTLGYTSVTQGGEYNSFIDFAFHPTNKDNFTIHNTTSGGEMNSFDIIVSQGNKNFTIRTVYYAYDGVYEFVCRAKADNQKYFGAFRDNAYLIALDTSTVRKYHVTSKTATAMGIKSGSVNMNGSNTIPLSYYFDNNAVFTPATFGTGTTGLGVSYLIRDFDSEDVKYNNDVQTDSMGKTMAVAGTTAKCTVWNGFESTADGKTLVNVTIQFGVVNNVDKSSIVVTKLGNTSFTSGIVVDEDDVISGATAYSGSAKFGAYPQLTSGKTYKGIKLTGGVGDKFDLGAMSINDTYFDDSWSYVKGQHVYNNFTDYNGAFYTGTDQAFTGAPAKSRSFISFVLDPSVLSDYALGDEKEIFKITLTEVGKPTNFVTYHVKLYYSKDSKIFELLITCTATNNPYNTAERYRSTGITFNETVRRIIECNGSQPQEVKLYYDYSQQAAYTNVAFSSKLDGIGAAFRIRDFNDITASATKSNYASIPNLIQNWSGFSNNANVNITLEMTGLANSTADNGIVLTSLGGYSFDNVELTTLPLLNVVEGEQTDLASALVFKSQTVEYNVNSSILEGLTYKVNDNVSSRNATLNDGDVVSIYNNDVKIGNDIIVKANDIKANIGLSNGTYKVFREGNEVTDNTFMIGDELRVYPGNETVSNLLLSDLRELRFNGTNYFYNPETPNQNLPFTYETKMVDDEEVIDYYTHVITANDLVFDNQLNVDFVFDRYCDVTVKDTADPNNVKEEVTYHWAVDGQFDFKMPTLFNGTEIARGTSTDKALVGYARTDVGSKDKNGNFVASRNDYKVADYKNAGSLVNYSSRGLGRFYYLRGEISGYKTAASLVPGVVFETIYVKVWIDTELKLPSSYNKEHAGLRFVVKFDKNDIDNYNKYQFLNVSKNPFGNIHNYITTEQELLDAGKGIAVDKIGSTHWLQGTWNNADTANKLGLVNATGKTSAQMEGKYGYLYIGFTHQQDIWHFAYENEDYYAYAITVKFNENSNYENSYVFMPIVNIREVGGSATTTMVRAITASPKSVATDKLATILKEEKNGETYTMLGSDGITYYSNYSIEDINWLATVAGDAREFSLVNA